jgi:hypothetical protein
MTSISESEDATACTGEVTSAETLGYILQQARLLSGLSQRELARRLRGRPLPIGGAAARVGSHFTYHAIYIA